MMTLWPSKQLQNMDDTINNYKIYHIRQQSMNAKKATKHEKLILSKSKR